MKIQSALFLILALVLTKPTLAVEKNTIGENTYNQVCAVCHGAGPVKAPKLGDKKAWKGLIAEGQVVLTAHGYVGVRAMPPKGGKEDLSVEQFAEAVNYMVNKSGGNWTSPDKTMLEKINKEIIKETATRKKTK
jgi:cytochrome c5